MSVAERVKQAEEVPARCASAQSFHRKPSAVGSIQQETVGRPLARPPPEDAPVQEEGEEELPYLERGQRWLERQEAHSLRRALEDMDVKEDKKIFDDAQDEAAELVWKHQNPNTPFRNPDAPYKNPDLPGYREHLRKGSTHARTTSWAQTAQDIQARQMKRRSRDSSASRSISGASKGSSNSTPSSRVPSDGSLKVPESPTMPLEVAEEETSREPRKRAVQFVEPTNEAAVAPTPHENGLKKLIRNRTPSPSKALQALGIGRKEEKKQETTPAEKEHIPASNTSAPVRAPVSAVPAHFRNPFSRARESKGRLSRTNTEPMATTKRLDRFEIQRNPPSQSRNPLYTTNSASDESAPATPDESVKMKDGKEIRSDDIRKATSASLKDRSAKLPTPTMVSDSPGRPIVSFQKDWKPKEVELKQEISPFKAVPESKPTELEEYSKPPPTMAEKPTPVVRKKVAASSGSGSMQLPSRERERVSPPPAPLVHAATEPIVPTLNHGNMPPIPSIAVSSAPPIPMIAVNDAPPSVPRIAVNDTPRATPRNNVNELPASLRIGVSSGRPVSRGSSHDSRPLPTITVNNHESRPLPSIAVNGSNPVPTIAFNDVPMVPDAVPSIAVSAPSISVSGPPARGSSTRPLPTPAQGRPGPRHAASAPPGSTQLRSSHITPTGFAHPRGIGAQCSTCALPIAGRIVTAAGVRFHPECFRCHHCGEGLECVAFYPEPESHRLDRVNRIRDRMAGYDDVPGDPEEDGDEGLRFYCHLDYHEFFSPRCKSCKTPIEGEVVVACGAEWHVGHFFCAQCGDVSRLSMCRSRCEQKH